jgi:flotillin
MIAQLPDMLRAAAESLQGANLTVLNGSDGMGQLISGLATQGIALYDTLRGNVGSREDDVDSTEPPPPPPAPGTGLAPTN